MPPFGHDEGVVCPSLKVLRFSGLDAKEVHEVANTCRSRVAKGATLDAVHIAGLSAEGVLSVLSAGVSMVNVDDNWVEEMFFLALE